MITRQDAYDLAAALAAAWSEEYAETTTGVHSDRAAAKLAKVVGDTAGSATAEHLLSDYDVLTIGAPVRGTTDPNAVIARWEQGRGVWQEKAETDPLTPLAEKAWNGHANNAEKEGQNL
ncbi:MAG: hypothetical protein WCL22_06640 [bacterium]